MKYLVPLILLLYTGPLHADYGPYSADVIRVIDGDTVEVKVYLWPGLTKQIKLRLAGIDTPEIRRAPACEKVLGKAASDYLKSLIAGKTITVGNIKNGKFAGRVVGDMYVDGLNVGVLLIEAGHSRKYNGGRRQGWCGE